MAKKKKKSELCYTSRCANAHVRGGAGSRAAGSVDKCPGLPGLANPCALSNFTPVHSL